MRDGAARLTFHPRLKADQYAELTRIVEHTATRAELRAAAESAAKRWGVELEYAEVGV
jgi:hypothetical protein